MTILNRKLYDKYKGNPIVIIMMFPNWIGMAEGHPIISFNPMHKKHFRKIFPIGKYKKL